MICRLTDEVHANPVAGIHLLLDVPAEHDVLRLADGADAAADREGGAAVAGHQVGVAGGARQGGPASAAGLAVVVLLGVVAVPRRLLAAPPVLGAPRG